MHCPGSLALSLSLPRTARVEREAAAWGTACHQIAERCLRQGIDPSLFIGEEETSGRYTFVVDEEMAACAEVYVEYCRTLARDADWFDIEKQFSLENLKPPFDSGGTADFTAYTAKIKTLEIVDLKGGKGVVVDVHENAQLRSYAIGALLAYPGVDVDLVKATIIQPRAPHADGIIRSETFHVVELIDWTTDLLAAMERANEALDALAATQDNTVLRDEWRDKYLKPGKCQFCPAEGVCPALRNDAQSVIDQWFDPDPLTGEPDIRNAPLDTSPETLARDLDLMDQLTNWMNARRAYAQQLAESGVEIPGYVLVDKRGTRKWIDVGNKGEAATAFRIAEASGLDPEKLWVSKLMSPAQVEKLLPHAQRKKLDKLWQMVVSGQNLVRADKTTRPAVGSLVERFFEPPQS